MKEEKEREEDEKAARMGRSVMSLTCRLRTVER